MKLAAAILAGALLGAVGEARADVVVAPKLADGEPAPAYYVLPPRPPPGTSLHDRRIAHAELVLWQTLAGLATGVEVCYIVDCGSSLTLTPILLGTVGLGFGVSHYATGGMDEGTTHLYNAGVAWGFWTSLAFRERVVNSEDGAAKQAGITIGLQIAGLGAAAALARFWHPDEGEVACANSFGLWAAIAYAWIGLADTGHPQLRDAVILADGAAILGGVVGSRWHPTRAQTLAIDAGGAIGIIGGGLVELLANTPGDRATGLWLLAGTASGLALATLGTWSWNHEARGAAVQIAPMPIRAPASDSLGLGVGARFAF